MAEIQEKTEQKLLAEHSQLPDIATPYPDQFAKFVMWCSVPSLLRYPPANKGGSRPTPREFAENMGIEDEAVLELIEIKTQTEFAAKYGVDQKTLYNWKQKMQERDVMADLRQWAKPLTRNVALSLYNKAIRGGLPDHYKLFFQIVNGWSEKIRIDKREIKAVRIEIVDPKHE
jgi:transposase-like protein